MDVVQILIPIIAVTVLAAGWAGVQVLAHKLGTKNHIDNPSSCGNGCACTTAGDSCKNK